ncbi:MAG: hypothetical protein IPN26_02090 [Bacteroidetes bacterium]|nr:hypothetical protein [Bacteroidota bacterium]
MKILITIVILVCYVTGVNATILRCNNNPGVTGTYQTFYDALLAASPGDTIHLEPSPISYGKVGGYPENLTQQPINKDSLTIIGNGINLSNHPGLQMDTLSSKIGFLSAQGNYWNFYSVDGQAAIFLYGHHNLFENCRFTFTRIYYHSNKLSHCYFPIAVGSNPFLDVS